MVVCEAVDLIELRDTVVFKGPKMELNLLRSWRAKLLTFASEGPL